MFDITEDKARELAEAYQMEREDDAVLVRYFDVLDVPLDGDVIRITVEVVKPLKSVSLSGVMAYA